MELDWVWLYYCATVFLGMSEKEFWKTSLRKLSVLISKHFEACGLEKKSEEEQNNEAFSRLMRL
ncbi:MAG TPA: hypothetical protein P5556_03100 [Candidatus Gastranaerophilales bacterium]|nr:hypothetical protein [Candidatus Gastranaerophilales bacterium]